MGKGIIALVIILIIVVGSMFYLMNDKVEVNVSESEGDDINLGVEESAVLEEDLVDEEPVVEDDVSEETITEEIKTFVITGENFKFVINGKDNPDIKVNKGDKVRIEFTSTSGLHDWVVNKFNVATNQVMDTAGMTSVEFIADEVGTFEYFCSVGSHRAKGMKGNLIVE